MLLGRSVQWVREWEKNKKGSSEPSIGSRCEIREGYKVRLNFMRRFSPIESYRTPSNRDVCAFIPTVIERHLLLQQHDSTIIHRKRSYT